jgi:hypothetical protein
MKLRTQYLVTSLLGLVWIKAQVLMVTWMS